MMDLLNALKTGDPRCVQRALDRAVPTNLRRAYAEGEAAALAGWDAGVCRLDGEERVMWLAGWNAMQGYPCDPMAAAQNRDHAEYRDLHDGDAHYDQHRGTEGSNL